jgi:putative endonuclease
MRELQERRDIKYGIPQIPLISQLSQIIKITLKMETKDFGNQGEEWATRMLTEKGYAILQRNYRKQGGEIDIVAFDPSNSEIVFVEVKSRRNQAFGTPEEAIDERKIGKMADTAQEWLAQNGKESSEWRLDLVALEYNTQGKPDCRHLINIS